MAKSKQTYLKKEKENKKKDKRKEKEEKKEARKTSGKGKSFEDMIAYVDDRGNFSSTPFDVSKREVIKLEDVQLGARIEVEGENEVEGNKGRISYFNESKGYGFIKDSRTKESLFFHLNNVLTPVKENDVVTFDKVRGPKGMSATAVSKTD